MNRRLDPGHSLNCGQKFTMARRVESIMRLSWWESLSCLQHTEVLTFSVEGIVSHRSFLKMRWLCPLSNGMKLWLLIGWVGPFVYKADGLGWRGPYAVS